MRSGVVIALISDSQILMQKRDNKKYIASPGLWGLPGGSCKTREKPISAVSREIKEETGYIVKNPTFYHNIYYQYNNERIKVYCFFEDYDNLQEINCYEGQKMEFKTIKEIQNLRTIPQHYMLAHKALKLYNQISID